MTTRRRAARAEPSPPVMRPEHLAALSAYEQSRTAGHRMRDLPPDVQATVREAWVIRRALRGLPKPASTPKRQPTRLRQPEEPVTLPDPPDDDAMDPERVAAMVQTIGAAATRHGLRVAAWQVLWGREVAIATRPHPDLGQARALAQELGGTGGEIIHPEGMAPRLVCPVPQLGLDRFSIVVQL